MQGSSEEGIDRAVEGLTEHIVDVRRYLHRHPEPSGEEFQTTYYLADLLEDKDIPYRLGPDSRGLVVDGRQGGRPRIALRADIDALRLQDEKTVAYRSREANRMHACGHDAHAAMLYGAVLALAEAEKNGPLPFSWRAIFQPAEETAKGAKEMIEAGVLNGVDRIIALHVDPLLKVGQIGFKDGPLTACCEEFEFLIEGEGGHGARPYTTKDPVAAATQLVQSLYAMIPRSLDSRKPHVLSIGVIQGGINPNVIPDTVQLRGTLRSTSREDSDAVKQKIRAIAEHVGSLTGTRIDFTIAYSLEGVYNDPACIETCREACRDLIPGGAVDLHQPSMGGEDFAFYLQSCPGCLLRLGTGTALQPVHHLHSSQFDINEKALPIGSRVLVRSVAALAASL